MSMVLWVTVMTALAGVGGTGLGGAMGALLRRDSDRAVSLLLSFAGGVMMSVVCFDLIENALYPSGGASGSVGLVIAGILFGYGAVFLLNAAIDRSAEREAACIDSGYSGASGGTGRLIRENHYEEHKKRNSSYQLFVGGVVMACAIALHNLPEGMVIGASFAVDGGGGAAFTGEGLAMATVIGLHNIPEGMAVSVPLVSGGMKRSKAVAVAALTGAPTILGALLGYLLGMMGPVTLSLSLSFASGAMLYVVFGELLPESILMWRSEAPAFAALLGVIVGLLVIRA